MDCRLAHIGALGALATALTFLPTAANAQALSEDAAVRLALAQPTIASRDEAEQAEAEANAEAAGRWENPDVELSRERVSGRIGAETEWRVGVEQPISLSGVRGSERRAAAADALATGAGIERRRQERAAATRIAYASCRAADERLAVLDDHSDQLRRIERAIELRAQAGDAAVYDLRRVRLELTSIEARRRLAAGEVTAACAELAALTGQPGARASDPLLLVRPINRPADQIRPDILAGRYRVDAAGSAAEAARRRQIPDVRVGLGYRRLEQAGGSADGPSLSLGIRVPLFNNGGAARRAADASRARAAAELTLAEIDVDAQRAATAARAEAAFDAATIAARGAEDANRVATTAEAAYQGGETDITDLIDGYRASSEARVEAIDLSERAGITRAQYLLAQGEETP
jgi:outer membrane protein, heavy metal efflux system